jgi:twitching motility protein PilT
MADSQSLAMKDLLDFVVQENASDLHIAVGLSPVVRIHGNLETVDYPPLKPDDTERLMKSITSESYQKGVRESGAVDFGFSFGNAARFRVSVFRAKGNYHMALRQIPTELLDLDSIGFPPQMKELLFKPRGLILVTGPTGSGKTTTLASMIDLINRQTRSHIITVEDPIEYYHQHKESIMTQREIGVDTPNFSEALKRALRQDPDVILVGEMRDLETMQAAITAAETGHLVLATLHTTGAARTVDRIVDAFPMAQQGQVRTQLASSIVAVVSQLLLTRQDKPGRIAAFELMITTPSIQALIRDDKTFRINSDIQTGGKWGMITLDAHLFQLYEQGFISYEDLITKSQDPDAVVQKIQNETSKKRK